MPLFGGKSKAAFSKNVETEMHAGKPQKQALAIAYAMKKRKGKKMCDGGMMADGGPVKDPQDDVPDPNPTAAADMQKGATSPGTKSLAEYWANLKSGLTMAEGGEVPGGEMPEADMGSEDFLSDETQTPTLKEGYTDEEDDGEKSILAKILSGVRARHMGKMT